MKLGIVGLGKMGSAMAQALASRYEIIGYEKSEAVRKKLRPALAKKIQLAESLEKLLELAETVVVATKPQQVKEVVANIRDHRLVISIAAGVSLRVIDSARSAAGPTIRAMPNLPLLIRRGITAYTGNRFCTHEELALAHEIFSYLGGAIHLEQEKMLHAVTALSGSGPAFVFLFLQNLEDAGVLLGLSRAESRRLAIATVLGATELVRQEDCAPQQLIHDVVSPGGTTALGLRALHKNGFPFAVQEAVIAAARRSVELAQEARAQQNSE
ncbi:MAG: pyrroline-5-carboxylate reductase [Turneriella sp.]|nr:pyrroline-5-carboxylate reductase [Turneriella sp.]